MKLNFRRICSVITAAAILSASSNVSAEELYPALSAEENMYIESAEDVSPAGTDEIDENDEILVAPDGVMPEITVGEVDLEEGELPSSYVADSYILSAIQSLSEEDRYYNSADEGFIGPIRNQGSFDSCWVFASLGALEASLAKNGGFLPDETDLSELQLAYFAYCTNADKENTGCDPLGLANGDYSSFKRDDFPNKSFIDFGGDNYYAGMALMNWIGAAPESIAPYSEISYSNHKTYTLPADYAYSQNIFNTTDMYIADMTDRAAVKKLILEHGAVASAVDMDSMYFNPEVAGAYFKSETDESATNHAITVVGWDDDYEVTNFASSNQPTQPGAWIVKNSWGPSNNNTDNGFIYISYCEASMNNSGVNAVAYDGVSAGTYDRNYHYDGCNTNLYIVAQQSNGKVYDYDIAAVFETENEFPEKVEGISFATNNPNQEYELKIYKDPERNSDGLITDPATGTPVYEEKGELTYAGYQTVKIPENIYIKRGGCFSAVVTLKCDSENSVPLKIPVSQDYSSGSYYESCNTHLDNSTYWKPHPNKKWTTSLSSGDSRDIRLKAYTSYVRPEVVAANLSVSQQCERNRLTWEAVDGIDSWLIERAGADGIFKTVKEWSAEDEPYEWFDEGILPEQTYTYRLRIGEPGSEKVSNTVEITESGTFDIIEESAPDCGDLYYGTDLSALTLKGASFAVGSEEDGITGTQGITAGEYVNLCEDETVIPGVYTIDYKFIPESPWFNEYTGSFNVEVLRAEPVLDISAETETKEGSNVFNLNVEVLTPVNNELVPEDLSVGYVFYNNDGEQVGETYAATVTEKSNVFKLVISLDDVSNDGIATGEIFASSICYEGGSRVIPLDFEGLNPALLANALSVSQYGDKIELSWNPEVSSFVPSIEKLTGESFTEINPDAVSDGLYLDKAVLPLTEYAYRGHIVIDGFDLYTKTCKILTGEPFEIRKTSEPEVKKAFYGMNFSDVEIEGGEYETVTPDTGIGTITEGSYRISDDSYPESGEYVKTVVFEPDSEWFKDYTDEYEIIVSPSAPQILLEDEIIRENNLIYLRINAKVVNSLNGELIPGDLKLYMTEYKADEEAFKADVEVETDISGSANMFTVKIPAEEILSNRIEKIVFTADSDSYTWAPHTFEQVYSDHTVSIEKDGFYLTEGALESIPIRVTPAGSHLDFFAYDKIAEIELDSRFDASGRYVTFSEGGVDVMIIDTVKRTVKACALDESRKFELGVRAGIVSDSVDVRIFTSKTEECTGIEFLTEEGESFTGWSKVTKGGESFTIEAVVMNSNGTDLPGRKVIWTSSDTSVAKITALGGNKVRVDVLKSGICRVTASVESGMCISEAFEINAIDPEPGIDIKKLTLNRKAEGAVSEEFEIATRRYKGVEIALGEVTTEKILKGKKSVDPAIFTVNRDEYDKFSVAINPEYRETIAAGSYDLYLNVNVEAPVEDLTGGSVTFDGTYLTYTYKLTVKVESREPKAKADGIGINLFDSDSFGGEYAVSSDMGDIESVGFEEDAKGISEMLSVYRSENGKWMYIFRPDDDVKTGKYTLKALVKVEGFAPVAVKITVKITDKKPVLEPDRTLKLTVSEEGDESFGTVVVKDKSTGEPVGATAVTDAGEGELHTNNMFTESDGCISVGTVSEKKYKNGQKVSAEFTLSKSNWAEPVTVKVKAVVYTTLPSVKLSKKSFTFNNKANISPEECEMYMFDVTCDRDGVSILHGECDPEIKVYSSYFKEYSECREEFRPVISYGENGYSIRMPQGMSSGTYKYAVYGLLPEYENIPASLTVKIVSNEPSVKLTTGGKINLLNREGSPVSVKASLKGISSQIAEIGIDEDKADLTAEYPYANDFEAVYESGSKAEIFLAPDADVPVGNVTLPVKVTMLGGFSFTRDITVKVTAKPCSIKKADVLTISKTIGAGNEIIRLNGLLKEGYAFESLEVTECPGDLRFETENDALALSIANRAVKTGTYTVTVRAGFAGGDVYSDVKLKVKITE